MMMGIVRNCAVGTKHSLLSRRHQLYSVTKDKKGGYVLMVSHFVIVCKEKEVLISTVMS